MGCTSNYLNGEDYVFTFTPTITQSVDIVLSNTLTWTGVFVTQGCPTAGGTCVASNTNSAGNPRITNVTLTAGVQYYIIVDTNPAPNCTPFSIEISKTNDLVCDARPITCGSTVSGTTVGATMSGSYEPSNCITSQSRPGVWYRVDGNGQVYTASLCGTTWNSKILVFSGPTCDELSCLGGNDDNGPSCLTASASYTWLSAVGTTYWILVTGSTTESNFNLSLSCTNVVTGCTGSFTDSGGSGGNYGNNQNNVYMFCPTNPGQRVRMTFSQFATENSFDFLTIFNGTTSSSGNLGVYTGTGGLTTAQASINNPSGCLTFAFNSDGSNTAAGWNAAISCIAPCQTINAMLNSTTPAAGGDGIIRICQNGSVTFNGSGTFSNSGAGAVYTWSFGDGTTATGQVVSHTYSTAGAYAVNLTITDPDGCQNANVLDKYIYVSTTPSITTGATPPIICLGQSSTLNATALPTTYTRNCTPPVSGTTFLPDGSGVFYNTSINVGCYPSGAVITSASDIQNICLNIEHSYIGDLDLAIVCPNGQTAELKTYPGGGTAFLGCPIDDEANNNPGTGRTYCFTPQATTLLINGATSSCGAPLGASIVPGDYMPAQAFTSLVGCPLNGAWTIVVEDNIGFDNGYIFNWDINFNPSIAPQTAPITFTPTITSQGWVPVSGLSAINSTTANVTPGSAGNPCYTYSVTDNFGCTSTAQQCVTVSSPPTASLTVPSQACTGNTATIAITATPNTTVTLTVGGVQQTVAVGATGTANYTTAALTAAGTLSVVLNSVAFTANATCATTYNTTFTPITILTSGAVPVLGTFGPYCYGVTAPLLPTTSANGVSGTWSPSTISTTNIGAANYTFTPSGTCTAAPVAISITVNERPIIYAHMVSNPTCTLLCNGVATVDVVGGASPYTYAWSNGVTTATNSNLCAGTYTVTVTDANGCTSQPFTPVAGCFQLTSILVDACVGGTNEGLNEMVFFQTGTSPLTVTGGTATWPSNSFTNFNCTNAAFIAAVNATITGGGQLLPVPVSGVIPPNSNVVIIMSNTTTSSPNTFQNLTGPVYVMFHCASVTAGYFGNSTAPAGPRTTVLNFGSCTDQAVYNTSSLVNINGTTGNTNQDGSTVLFSQNGTPTYVNYGCVAPYTTQSNSVTLTAPPPPTASISGTSTICSGGSSTISFSGTPNAVVTYTINGGANQTITLDATGIASLATGALTSTTTYSLVNVATTTTPPCIQPLTGNAIVTVIQPPTATIGTSASICFNTSTNISFTGTPNATITYTVNSGANQTIVLSAAGTASLNTGNLTGNTTYSLVSAATSGTPSCNASVNGTAVISILPLPTASINGTTSICSGNTATISFSGTPNAIVTYTLNGGGNQTIALNATGVATITTAALTANATYQLVSVATVGSPVCSAPAIGNVIITVNPIPVVNISGSSSICSGSSTALTLSSIPTGATFTYAVNAIGVTGAVAGTGSSISQVLTVNTAGVNGVVEYAATATLNGCPSILNSVFVNVRAPGNAGTSGSINVCASGPAINLFSSLGGTPQTTGVWTGPSALGGGSLGSFTPGTSSAGTYTYTVTPTAPCPVVSATVVVSVGSSPTAVVSYAGPYCTSVTATQNPTIVGTTGGIFTSSPSGLSMTASGVITPSASGANTYTITYTIPAANGCSAFITGTTVVITGAPTIPTLTPANACANTATTFTAGNGESYEFFVNGVSQGPSSVTNTFNSAGLAAGSTVCVRNTPAVPFVMNGLINESQWGAPIATSVGGPNPSGFGGNNRIDALYMKNMKGSLYGAVAGNENDGSDQTNNNWILLFIDSKAGGFNNLQAWINRSNTPPNTLGVRNLALYSNVVFDAGFEADYILTMNQANATAFFDLYDMQTNTNNFLGSNVANPTQFGFAGNTGVGDITRGFEFNFPLSLIGNPTYQIKMFAMMVNDPNALDQTFVSNQFLTRANNGEGNYGNGFIDFNAAAPNPVSYFLNADCFQETCVTMQPQVVPVFNAIPSICFGGTAPVLPTTSTNGINGTWTGPVSNTATGNYTFTPTPPQCATTTTTTVTVRPQVITNLINHN